MSYHCSAKRGRVGNALFTDSGLSEIIDAEEPKFFGPVVADFQRGEHGLGYIEKATTADLDNQEHGPCTNAKKTTNKNHIGPRMVLQCCEGGTYRCGKQNHIEVERLESLFSYHLEMLPSDLEDILVGPVFHSVLFQHNV